MKKTIKLFTAFLAVLSLSACESLGEKMEFNEGVRKQAEMEVNMAKNPAPVYGQNVSLKVSASSGSTKMNTTTGGRTEYDLNNIYYHSKVKASVSLDGTSASATQNTYVYYKDGALYTVKDSNVTGSSKTYNKETMTSAEAKQYIISSYIDGSASLSSLTDGSVGEVDLSSTKSVETYYRDIIVKEKSTYYSKGEGNLSYRLTVNIKYSGVAITAKLNGTIDNYLLKNMSLSASFKASGVSETLSMSAKLDNKCTLTYPNLSGYVYAR